jgi:hypothetical protein
MINTGKIAQFFAEGQAREWRSGARGGRWRKGGEVARHRVDARGQWKRQFEFPILLTRRLQAAIPVRRVQPSSRPVRPPVVRAQR